MEKKNYEPPQLKVLGTVRELTELTSDPTNCSALPSDFSTEDGICEIHDR
jgi:hypothetical protein